MRLPPPTISVAVSEPRGTGVQSMPNRLSFHSLLAESAKRIVSPLHLWKRLSFAPRLAAQLESIGSDLNALAGSSESDFLALGEKLQEFHLRTAEISQLSSSIAELLSSTEVSGAAEAFDSIFDKAKQFKLRSKTTVEILGEVVRNLSELLDHMEGFRKIVLFLRVLCVSTRIETARIEGEEGLEIVAEDIAGMIGSIELHHHQLIEGAETLINLTRQTLGRIRSLETVRESKAEIIFDHTLTCMNKLREQRARSSALATETALRYREIAGNIGEIVTCMQFHDITRQRVEHAASAILSISGPTRMAGHCGGENGRATGLHWFTRIREKAGPSRFGMIGEVCELQSVQLRLANEELIAAVESIIRNLRQIASNISDIAKTTHEMAGFAETRNTHLPEIERGISSILDGLKDYGESESEVSEAMNTAGETLGHLCQFAENIKAIGSKMKLIALNAIVKASKMKEGGGPLGKLADAIHQLSIESDGYIQSVTRSLAKISDASAKLSSEKCMVASRTLIDLESMASSLEHPLKALRSADTAAVSLLTKMDERAFKLAEDIGLTTSETTVHHGLARQLNSMADQLSQAAAKTIHDGTRNTKYASEGYLQAIKATYTMESERLVHESLINKGAPEKAPGTRATISDRTDMIHVIAAEDKPLAVQQEDANLDNRQICSNSGEEKTVDENEFGENVELF